MAARVGIVCALRCRLALVLHDLFINTYPGMYVYRGLLPLLVYARSEHWWYPSLVPGHAAWERG